MKPFIDGPLLYLLGRMILFAAIVLKTVIHLPLIAVEYLGMALAALLPAVAVFGGFWLLSLLLGLPPLVVWLAGLGAWFTSFAGCVRARHTNIPEEYP